MIYQILQINQDSVSGSVIDKISDLEWVVVADIPRQMIKCNREKPQHISLVSGEKDDSFSDDFEEFWTLHMAKKLRNWLITEHPEKLYAFQNEPIAIDYNLDISKNDDKNDLRPLDFFGRLFSHNYKKYKSQKTNR